MYCEWINTQKPITKWIGNEEKKKNKQKNDYADTVNYGWQKLEEKYKESRRKQRAAQQQMIVLP